MRDAFLDGMMLAATALDDRDGSAARAGLSEPLAAALGARLESLGARDETQRRREVRRLAGTLRRVPEDADLPARAAALLAADVPREVGRRWAASAPKVRRGFAPQAALKTTLRRLAASADPRAADAERAAAAHLDDPARDAPDDDAARREARLRAWAERLSPGEDDPMRVLGALALGARGEGGGDGTSRGWRRVGRELARVWEATWRG